MVTFIALLHLGHGQIMVEPVQLLGLQVLQQEAIAVLVLDVGPQSTAVQNRLDNSLVERTRVTGVFS